MDERRQAMIIISFRHWKEVFGSPALFVFILLSGCSYDSTDSSNNNLIQQDEMNNNEDIQPEDFSQFIERFHSDTLFQRRRLSESLVLFDSNIEVQVPSGGDKYDATYSWTQNDVNVNLLEVNKNKQNPEYHTELMCISDSVICENIFVSESNRAYLLEFSRVGRKWFLTQLLVNH